MLKSAAKVKLNSNRIFEGILSVPSI